jgi:hypothetical protein
VTNRQWESHDRITVLVEVLAEHGHFGGRRADAPPLAF